MSLLVRLEKSTVLTPQERMILRLLAGEETLTSKQIIENLMADPYDLTFEEVFEGLESLKRKGLLVLGEFRKNNRNYEVDISLTFSIDWVLKI